MTDRPRSVIVLGIALGAWIAYGVHVYHHRAVRPIYRWVRVETIWSQNWNFKRFSFGPYFDARRACVATLRPNGLETVGDATMRRSFNCVRICKHSSRILNHGKT